MSATTLQPVTYSQASVATAHCLTGCAAGEITGMIIASAIGLGVFASVTISVLLAFAFGYALTIRGVRKAGISLSQALKVALAADTVSILVMEITDNTVMVSVPGAMAAGLSSWLFWLTLAGSLLIAFIITVPVNKWLMARGKGHAVVHAYHGHSSHNEQHDMHHVH